MAAEDTFTFANYPQGFGILTEVRRNGKPAGMVLWNSMDQELDHARYFAPDGTEAPAGSAQAQTMKNAITGGARPHPRPATTRTHMTPGAGRPPSPPQAEP